MASRDLDEAVGFPVRVDDRIDVEFDDGSPGVRGRVAYVDDHEIEIVEGNSETILAVRTGDHGAAGWIEGLADLVRDGRAVVYSDRIPHHRI